MVIRTVFLLLLCTIVRADRPRLLLDADTANEIDDLYAITRMLRQDRFDVVALNSTQWVHYLAEEHLEAQGFAAGETTVGASQRMNEELVELLERRDLPLNLGSVEPMGRPWGGREPKDSPAARSILRHARAASADDKLRVVCLGAATNLASAIALDPSIAAKIEAYLLGFRIDADRGVWNKATFNVRRDLNGADLLLDSEDLALHVMPGNVAERLVFRQDDTFARHERLGPLGAYLTRRWNARFATFDTWIMWDLALVQAILHPEMATEVQLTTPPENTQRQVEVFSAIDAAAMQADFWRAVMP